MTRRAVLVAALLAAAAAGAEPASPAVEPRSPADMTVDERVAMMRGANDYNACVYGNALEQIDADPDIRRIADLALGYCEPRLEALRGTIEGWGFDGHFAEGFARNVRSRAARKILPELAIRKSR